MIKDYLIFSFNSLKSRKLRSWLTVLGILIGITAVVALIGLGEGLKAAINSQFGISATEVLTVQAGGLSAAGPPGTGVVNPLTQEDTDAIMKLSVVERAIPRNMETGKLEFNDNVVFGMSIGVPDGEDRKFTYDALELEIEEGRLLKDGDTMKVVLGNNFYTDNVGLDKTVMAGDTVLIQDKKFDVVGIIKKKGSFIFDNMVVMNEDVLNDIFEIDNEVDIIAVQVKDKSLMQKGKEDIEKLLRKRRNVKEGEEDFSVETPDSAMSDINSILTGVQIFIAIIASISIIVGSIGITNTMFTSVTERKKQIGIMKSIGARNSDIFYLFSIESGMLGMVGGFIGTVIGGFISFVGTMGINIFIGANIQPQINLILIFGALMGSFLIGSIAGTVPAMRAAELKPVDALRQ
jgi:putative ABC transport system permease protein